MGAGLRTHRVILFHRIEHRHCPERSLCFVMGCNGTQLKALFVSTFRPRCVTERKTGALMKRKSKKKSRGVIVHVGQFEFLKINTGKRDWRDAYHWILSLTWAEFAAVISGSYLALNLVFAALYSIGGDCIAEMPAGSFLAAFFFSVQTLATVGYGHMYPATLYGNIVTTIEILVGMFGMAVMTGLIF